MLLTSSRFTLITGAAAPESFADLEARVVARLEVLLGRTLVLDEGTAEGYTDETVPAGLAEAIAWGVLTLHDPQLSALPQGVSSVNVAGEYSTVMAYGMTTSADGTALPIRYAFASDLGGRCVTLALRYRRVAL
jgi:hypothetical protein